MEIKTKEIQVIENCPKGKDIEYKKCQKCTFNVNGNCVYGDCTLSPNLIHINEFKYNDNVYHIKKWQDLSKEEQETLLNITGGNDISDDATCYACCFFHKIPGKGNICQLRYSVNSEETAGMLCCYDDEFWEKIK
jgi:hypothetical protein